MKTPEYKDRFVERHPNLTVCFFSVAGSIATTLVAYLLGELIA